MIALFRICDFDSGRVLIDDVDIASINLRELRRSLAIIPQDPVLFSGPLRENLDPFHEYADERIWAVLQQVHMAESLRRWGAGLDFEVAEGGDNLSVGQRQLLCIGRALLKDSKVVVLDEATANVDTATDALIQTTIQHTFRDKTVLTIAHRINTILHCDKIAVMDAGRVAEFGSPSELLARPQSVFAALASSSTGAGIANRMLCNRKRWPKAHVTFVNSSSSMLDVAQREHKENEDLDTQRLAYIQADFESYEPERPVDLIFSNAALQWVNADKHKEILPRLYSFLKPGRVLAFQIPDTRLQPSHQRMVDAAKELGLSDRVAGVRWVTCEKDPSFYYELYKGADGGVELDMWAAVYAQVSRG
ncbi:unnamed protein product [Phytophthora lilii]|uniref:Unnamed protein product n=1 Tax=Phytophthora lilii TaxID=2077276 RepID=A0A9W6X3K0_9STRA|nr:unnamed protein product [Phytophthora lilii]